MSSTLHERPIRLSERLSQLTASATVALNGRMAQMRAEGIDVVSFGQGEPDFPTPTAIKVAAFDAIERNRTRYTPAGGITELRQAIARRIAQDCGITYTPAQIAVTSGVKEGLFLAFLAVCDPGDEVIVPAPYWVSYIEQARMAGAEPVVIDTDETTNFKITPEQLAAHLTPRTRVLILSSPANPTGSVYTESELQGLADVIRRHVQEHDLLVMSDEIYDRICYVDYARWLRVAPDLADYTLLCNGLSKTFAMTGWRIGYIAGPEPILKALRAIQSHSTTHPNSIAQYAALVAYSDSPELAQTVNEMVNAFQVRRDLVLQKLAEIPGVSCVVPNGAFYVYPNVSGL
ncbi:MAG: pyridoxal phosphate-dependent aminotransferase, partial [Chloroflexaceae bacterium]|nr:pyridoxal phosphate-dependent aminotransferase [Chloroflexaceae bacterium]